jgi:hypothetical protein
MLKLAKVLKVSTDYMFGRDIVKNKYANIHGLKDSQANAVIDLITEFNKINIEELRYKPESKMTDENRQRKDILEEMGYTI